ncbi:unnamed protein product [Calypogeia fissa]
MFSMLGSWTEAALLLLAIIVFLSMRGRKSDLHLPPGPRPYPVVGNLPELSRQIYRDFERLGKKYGPLLYLKMGAVPVVVVQNAELARVITKVHDQVFAYRPQDLSGVQILLFEGDDVGFAPIGAHWRYLRRLYATELFLPKRLNTFKDQRLEEIKAIMRAMLETSKHGGTVNVYEYLNALMYNVVTQMVAGKSYYGSKAVSSKEIETFRTLMVDFFALFNGFNIVDWFPYMRVFGDLQGSERRMRGVAARLDAFLQGCIDEHRNRKKAPELHQTGESQVEEVKDFVDLLLEVHGVESGEQFGDRNIKIMLQASFIAGTESTSSAMQWALTELVRHPKLMKKVQDEVDFVVGRERMVRDDDIPQLKLLEAVVKETLRLHPPGPFLLPRQPIQNCKVGGYDIPSTARVFVSTWAIGRDPAVWENPLEFLPERFLDNPRDFNGSFHEFLPFGSGRRICPGMNLGLLMLRLQLANLVHLCNYSLPPGQMLEDMDMTVSPGFNLPKRVPLEVIATPRLAPEFYKTHLGFN